MWCRAQHLVFTLETVSLAMTPIYSTDRKRCSDRASKTSTNSVVALLVNQSAVCLKSLRVVAKEFDLSARLRKKKLLIDINRIKINRNRF